VHAARAVPQRAITGVVLLEAADGAVGQHGSLATAISTIVTELSHDGQDDTAVLAIRWSTPAPERGARTERSFPPASDSVRLARQFVHDSLPATESSTSDDIALMVSELATNCVRHAEDGFRVAVAYTSYEIRVGVTDTAYGDARPRTADPSDPDGRGLQIVDRLSTQRGVNRTDTPGKTVWFTITTGEPIQQL
jgi:anti-sigma regulatory factor (Ser/Thr protein kinase)